MHSRTWLFGDTGRVLAGCPSRPRELSPTVPGYCLVGDAGCFIDPLLSTGVHLAMHSAMLCAASIASTLRGEIPEQQAGAFFEQSYRQTYLRLMAIVSGMYSQYDGKEAYF